MPQERTKLSTTVEYIVSKYPFLLDKKQDWTAKDEWQVNAIRGAASYTKRLYSDGKHRMALIAALYWNAPSDILNKISAATAEEWKEDFLRMVTDRLHMASCSNCVYWRPVNPSGALRGCHFCFDTGKMRVHGRNMTTFRELIRQSKYLQGAERCP